MKKKSVYALNFYELLNLPLTARTEDVEQEYLHLTSVYSDNSKAGYGALRDDERKWMIKTIQNAYETLMNEHRREEYDKTTLGLKDEDRKKAKREEHLNFPKLSDRLNRNGLIIKESTGTGQRALSVDAAAKLSYNTGRITGAHLRNIRMARGASLEEISDVTKVKKAYLDAIEREDTKTFPAPIFMKGFLKAYAKALGLDPVEISEKYLSKD